MSLNFFETILKRLHAEYRKDDITICLARAIANVLEHIQSKIDMLYHNFFFDSLNEDGADYFEKLLQIEKTTNDLNTRRVLIRNKWISKRHLNLELIQNTCDAWANGLINADFVDGKIKLAVVGVYGYVQGLKSLKNILYSIKPAHIPYCIRFKYLKIEDIHKVQTVESMGGLKIGCFYGHQNILEENEV